MELAYGLFMAEAEGLLHKSELKAVAAFIVHNWDKKLWTEKDIIAICQRTYGFTPNRKEIDFIDDLIMEGEEI